MIKDFLCIHLKYFIYIKILLSICLKIHHSVFFRYLTRLLERNLSLVPLILLMANQKVNQERISSVYSCQLFSPVKGLLQSLTVGQVKQSDMSTNLRLIACIKFHAFPLARDIESVNLDKVFQIVEETVSGSMRWKPLLNLFITP